MVWYRKYQFRYIIGLWSQWWKKCAFPHARHVYSLENFFTGGRCRLAWRVLTLADKNYRGELHESLCKCFKNFVYPRFARRKKRQNTLFISQFMNCVMAARGKRKLNNRRIGQMNYNFFNKELVRSKKDTHLWNVSKALFKKSVHFR